MIRSMTGYGRSARTVDNREITVEIRSVNNRYLDCNVKLPRIYSYVEDPIKQLIKEHVTRGKVDVFVTVTNTTGEEVKVSLNRPLLEGYLAAMRTMTADYQIRDDITVSALSRLPDIFIMEKPDMDEEARAAEILQTAAEALDSYDAMRTTEGAAMERDLRSRRETILSLVEKVEAGSCKAVSDVIIDPNKVFPQTKKYVVLAGLLGAVVVCGVLVLAHLLHDTIVDDEDVQKKLGLPVLGLIPEV